MRMFGKNIQIYEDETFLDSAATVPLEYDHDGRSQGFALSHHNDKAESDKADKAEWDKALEGRRTIICENFWDDFVLLSKACLLHDREADLYDVFETIRTKFLGGWGYTQSFLDKLDSEIEAEYQKQCLANVS